ncbi:MFS transporter [Pseudolysinimonas kribbensis]|uniref:MFS transporter n=1 Tax=Pseudolysinimonas kribbensis TaxID=433641 RepID=UPI0024E0443E|nr:MFS transporter [Pseudolysinimonas kribbensis]
MPSSTPMRTFAALGLSVASFSTLQSLIVPVLPAIQADLHTGTAGVTWAMTAWLISAAVATPLLGRVGDLVGRRRTFLVTVAAVALGSLIAATAPTLGVLLIARVIQGLGGAMFPLAFGLLREAFPARRVPSAIGGMSAILAIGSGLGTVLAGPLVGVLGWRGLFLVPLVLTVAGACSRRSPCPNRANDRRAASTCRRRCCSPDGWSRCSCRSARARAGAGPRPSSSACSRWRSC